jgi:hypothetical protein
MAKPDIPLRSFGFFRFIDNMGFTIKASESTGRARTATIARGRDGDVVFPPKI